MLHEISFKSFNERDEVRDGFMSRHVSQRGLSS